jgi:hypothetical protein
VGAAGRLVGAGVAALTGVDVARAAFGACRVAVDAAVAVVVGVAAAATEGPTASASSAAGHQQARCIRAGRAPRQPPDVTGSAASAAGVAAQRVRVAGAATAEGRGAKDSGAADLDVERFARRHRDVGGDPCAAPARGERRARGTGAAVHHDVQAAHLGRHDECLLSAGVGEPLAARARRRRHREQARTTARPNAPHLPKVHRA